MLYSNIYIYVYTKSRLKASKLKERRKKETLLDSNPQRLSVKDSLLSIRLSGILFFLFIKVILPQSKADILRRFPKIGRKVIEYSYVSGQCRQTISHTVTHYYSQEVVFDKSKEIPCNVCLLETK